MNEIESAFKIDNVKLISYNVIKERYYKRTVAEIRICDEMFVFNSTDVVSTDILLRFANMLKDEDCRYIVSEVLMFSNLNFDSHSSLDRLRCILNRDPDEVICALKLLIGFENSDDYIRESKELIIAIGGICGSFTINNIKLQYGPFFVSCVTIVGNVNRPYISEQSAELLNPVVAYLDQLGVLKPIINKIRMLKLNKI